MDRRPVLLLLTTATILMVGCERRTPVLTDEQIARLRAEEPGLTPVCLDGARYEGIKAIPEKVDECFEMAPQRRFDGLWRHQLETMIFCPTPQPTCAPWESDTWVSFASGDYPEGLSYPGVFRVSFLGRKTAKRGIYGHMGMSEYEIVVDRMLAIKEVEDSASGHPFVF